jgi:hypothetical protein
MAGMKCPPCNRPVGRGYVPANVCFSSGGGRSILRLGRPTIVISTPRRDARPCVSTEGQDFSLRSK